MTTAGLLLGIKLRLFDLSRSTDVIEEFFHELVPEVHHVGIEIGLLLALTAGQKGTESQRRLYGLEIDVQLAEQNHLGLILSQLPMFLLASLHWKEAIGLHLLLLGPR